jgi:hypothetical protein
MILYILLLKLLIVFLAFSNLSALLIRPVFNFGIEMMCQSYRDC